MTRKRRTKARKLKFLSLLGLELSPENATSSAVMSSNSASTSATNCQLNLFPLHPQQEDEKLADFFAAGDGGATTLTALLGAESPSDDLLAESPSLMETRDSKITDSEESALLVRAAMRGSKDTCHEEEKWVCYEEVTSCAADLRCKVRARQKHQLRLSSGPLLKLDYQEIMNAWCDKGPLYLEMEAASAMPQTVPEIYDDFLFSYGDTNGMIDCWSSNGGLWVVPENNVGVKGEQIDEGELKFGHREASVLRYKEKRRNRLFSKRIRYEVRKINAEKRPRVKGRFVKRS